MNEVHNSTSRYEIAELITRRLPIDIERMQTEFSRAGRIGSTWLDNLLPEDLAREIYQRFPSTDRMMLKKSIKEHKHVAAQMDNYDPLLEEVIYAFQEPAVVELVGRVTGLQQLEPDTELYAGGISAMAKGGYLRPHLDNSHDKERKRYRVLNLLFYVTPEWKEEYGGSLELWDEGPHRTPRTIPSLFNRLVLMLTDSSSWHSVNEIRHDGRRCCVSNYYFSSVPPQPSKYFHATTFRAERPGIADVIMQADNLVRTAVLRNLAGVYKNPHIYKKSKPKL